MLLRMLSKTTRDLIADQSRQIRTLTRKIERLETELEITRGTCAYYQEAVSKMLMEIRDLKSRLGDG